MGGSLGMAAGEALITGMMKAVEDKTPFVLFTASGGARMQEGILSLMQMPRVTVGGSGPCVKKVSPTSSFSPIRPPAASPHPMRCSVISSWLNPEPSSALPVSA